MPARQEQQRFGGDRALAVRGGLDRPWADINAQPQRQLPSATELLAGGLANAVAPWGTPAPGPYAVFDADATRGITNTPDEAPLWDAWAVVASAAAARNQAAGVSAACQSVRAPAPTRDPTRKAQRLHGFEADYVDALLDFVH